MLEEVEQLELPQKLAEEISAGCRFVVEPVVGLVVGRKSENPWI